MELVAKGEQAKTALRVLEPIIDKRLEALVRGLANCEPKYPQLIKYQGEIRVLQLLKQDLYYIKNAGDDARGQLGL